GQPVERKAVTKDGKMPGSVSFELIYTPGKLEAVSYSKGQEISRDQLETSGKPAKLSVIPEKTVMRADGHDLVYVNIDVLDEKGRLVTDAAIELTACTEGSGYLAGFGTGNPVTEENYTDNKTTSFGGHATAVIRSSYETGKTVLTVSAEGMKQVQVVIG
ncbi:MAG: glycoside hydrolase family 2 protein, partial [Candidatus Limivivens sp.]|nr:glycoside hydrolase family 2 protein [Candidatus Limivivens sp.]